MPTELTADQAAQLLPGRKLHVIEVFGITSMGGEWTPSEVIDLLYRAEKIERRSGTEEPYGHELAILTDLGRWVFVAI